MCTVPMEVLVTGEAARDDQMPSAGALTAAGNHLLRVEVQNGGGPRAMLVRAALKTFCSPNLEFCCC